MDIVITSIFYLMIGCGVGVALAVRERRSAWFVWITKPVAAVFFWPFFVPLLLDGDRPTSDRSLDRAHLTADDHLSKAIRQVEQELDSALASLDGWSDSVLSREHDRFEELRSAWRTQAERVRELDRLLTEPAFQAPAMTENADDRMANSERTRQENIARLKSIRERLHHDLLGTIAWVRELVTMIHLAKYTGAPASRADELVRQIATAVEGLTEVNGWQQPSHSLPARYSQTIAS